MKRWLIPLLFGAALWGQTPVKPVPDCVVPSITLTDAGSGAIFNNMAQGCSYWSFVYTSVGFAAVSVVFQSAPNATGDVPGTWVTFAGSTVSGSNPGTATDQGGATLSGFYPWLRITLASKTGTGTVRAYAYGYRPDTASISQAGGVPASSVPFSGITSSTNTTAAMVLGTGSSLTTSGNGTNNATSIGGVTVSGTPTPGQVPTATSGTAATWQPLPPSNPSPAFNPSQIISGCGVEYDSGLTFTVGWPCTYVIDGQVYSTSALTTVTLDAADGSNPRIDLIIVDNTGVATKITGTAAASPVAPTVDPTTQIELTFVYVPTASSTPGNFTTTVIYDENTEWTCTASANLNCASTNNPYHGTKDIEATTAVLNNNVTLVKPAAGTENLSLYNALVFYLRSKATWPTGNGGASAARTLTLWWQNGSTQVGNQITIRDGQFGFLSSTTSGYQQIYIPMSLFNTGSAPVTTLKFNVSGTGGSSTIGFYIDQVSLQTSPTIVTPTSIQRVFGITVDGGGSAITTGVKGDTQMPVTCRINYWTIRGDQSGSIVFDIWKLAFATGSNPTVANTITASAKPTLSSAINATSTAVSTWTGQGQVTAGDMIRFNVDSATTVTRATLVVGCLQ